MRRLPDIALLLLIAGAARLASAHAFDPLVLLLQELSPGRFAVQWRLGPEAERQPTLALPPHCNPVLVRGPEATTIDCGRAGLRGSDLSVPSVAAGTHDAFIRITFADAMVVTGMVNRGAPAWRVPGSSNGGGWVTAARYVELGIEHILLGADHLLFVLGLLLLVQRLRMLIATLTAFTLAHSVSLALAVLDVVRVPAAPIEVLIAASIALIAYELTRAANAAPTLTRRRPWVVALAFGLLHGLGFAGALREVGLPAGHIPLALLAFNVGVELGQLLFVAVAFWPVRWWQRHASGSALLRLAPAYGIGIASVVWVMERIAAF